MAVTYLDSASLSRIIYFDASIPSYSTVLTNLTTGDVTVIPTTVAVGDIVYIQPGTSDGWKDILFHISQAQDGNITGVWEYNKAQSGTWVTMPNLVDGTKAFTLTGDCRVVFDMPNDQRDLFTGSVTGSVQGVACLRFRVTAVTASPTVACTVTGPSTFGYYNAVKVSGFTSGTPATVYDLYTADTSGTRIVAPPLPSTTGMICAELFPGETGAIRLNFILSGTTAGAGDTLDITGTGADGETITESIDVSAGDGTYLTAYSYSAITSFNCTGWTDGTVEVDQRKWGVVNRLGTITTFNTATTCRNFFINRAGFRIASGAFFTMTSQHLLVERSMNDRRGLVSNQGTLTLTSSSFIINNLAAGQNSEAFGIFGTTGTLTMNNSVLRSIKRTTANDEMEVSGTVSVTNSYIGSPTQFTFPYASSASAPSFTTSVVDAGRWWTQGQATAAAVDWGDTVITGALLVVFGFVASNLTAGSWSWQSQSGQTISLTNVTITAGYPTSLPGSNNQLNRKYTLDVTVEDIAGNAISGATVICKNEAGTQQFSVTTASDGTITQQTLLYQLIRSSGLGSLVTHTYTLTISAPGYQTATVFLPMDQKTVETVALEKVVPIILTDKGKLIQNVKSTDPVNLNNWVEL